MERSGADDAWDEPPDDDAADDALYPPAPLPAHERPWRHPSEMGQAAWEHSEPPMVIGRGLLVTTGAIGCALGLAVLMLLVPRGGDGPVAHDLTGSSAPAGTPNGGPPPTPSTTPLVSAPTLDGTLPGEAVPPTVLVRTDRVATPSPAMAVAVAVSDVPFMVTTARAVAALDSSIVDVIGPDDVDTRAAVTVQGDLAFIRVRSRMSLEGFHGVGSAEPGDTVTVLGDDATSITYPEDDASVVGLDPTDVREGTPVVDADGSLVALCTIVRLDEAARAAGTTSAATSAASTGTTSTTSTSTSTVGTDAGTDGDARADDGQLVVRLVPVSLPDDLLAPVDEPSSSTSSSTPTTTLAPSTSTTVPDDAGAAEGPVGFVATRETAWFSELRVVAAAGR